MILARALAYAIVGPLLLIAACVGLMLSPIAIYGAARRALRRRHTDHATELQYWEAA